MALNEVWKTEFSVTGSEWYDSENVYFRNVSGSPILSAELTGYPIPGVLRCTVTDVTGDIATVTIKKINFHDSHHPSIDEVGATFEIGATYDEYEYVWFLNSVRLITNHTIIVGDSWEIGYGYFLNSTTGSWTRILPFGILIPGDVSDSIFMRLTNIDDRPRANVLLQWENTGDDFIGARLQDGVWVAPETAELLLQDDNEIEGYIDPAGSCIVEFRATPSSAADSSNNMIQVSLTVQSLEI